MAYQRHPIPHAIEIPAHRRYQVVDGFSNGLNGPTWQTDDRDAALEFAAEMECGDVFDVCTGELLA